MATTITDPNSGISILSTDLNLIKKVIGYPKVEMILLTDAEIIEYCITEPLRSYFIKFPLRVEAQQEISSQPLEIAFPDTQTFSPLSVAIVGKAGTTSTTSNFWQLACWQNNGNYKNNMIGNYGIRGYNPNHLRQTRFDRLQENSTIENRLITQDYRIDIPNRKITVYTSLDAKVDITWAKFSLDFSTISYERKNDVIHLCQIELLRHLADTVNLLSDSDLSVTFNPSDLYTRADSMEDKLRETWDSIPNVVWLSQN
jgi:hypothetical protein